MLNAGCGRLLHVLIGRDEPLPQASGQAARRVAPRSSTPPPVGLGRHDALCRVDGRAVDQCGDRIGLHQIGRKWADQML